MTSKYLILVGKELIKKGVNKGKFEEVIKRYKNLSFLNFSYRKIELKQISKIGLSPFQDDFFVLFVHEEYSSLLETPLKTEFLSSLR